MSKTNSNDKTNQPVEIQEKSRQDLENTICAFQDQFRITESIVEGPEDSYAEIFCLQNGDTVREEYYDVHVNEAEMIFTAKLINEGFQDTEGRIWAVEMKELDASPDPMENLILVGPFKGTTEFYRYINRLMEHPRASSFFRNEVKMHIHTNEQTFLDGITEDVATEIIEEYQRLKVIFAQEEL